MSAVQTRFVNAFKSAVRASKEDDLAAPRIDSQAKYQLRLVEKVSRTTDPTETTLFRQIVMNA